MSYVVKQTRKRGRPAGKDRTPLNAEERRARNALYERQRREDMAAAIAELADAAGINKEMSNNKLLQAVIVFIRKKFKQKTIEDMRSANLVCREEIQRLEFQLGITEL